MPVFHIHDQRVVALIVLLLTLIVVYLISRTVFRAVKWILQSIWYLLTGKRRHYDPSQSTDWLTRAQAKQEIRFQNSLPPLLSQAKLPKKQRKKKTVQRKAMVSHRVVSGRKNRAVDCTRLHPKRSKHKMDMGRGKTHLD